MDEESAQAVAGTWRTRGYDARIVRIGARWYVLVLREDNQRYYVYAA